MARPPSTHKFVVANGDSRALPALQPSSPPPPPGEAVAPAAFATLPAAAVSNRNVTSSPSIKQQNLIPGTKFGGFPIGETCFLEPFGSEC